jgi:hypothetical protein
MSDDIPVATTPVCETLRSRELLDYREYKSAFIEWLLHVGKDPEHAEGYAQATIKPLSYRIDGFYRWLWDERGYTTSVAPTDADEYVRSLVYSDREYSTTHKSSMQKCLNRLFEWRRYEHG